MSKYDNVERARRKVIFGLANVKTENLADVEANYGVCLDEIYGRTFNALLKLKLIDVDREGCGIKYTPEGLARLEEVTYFLYSKFAKDRCDELPSYDDPHYQALVNQHYAVKIDPEDRRRFEELEISMSDQFMWRLKIG